MAGYKPYRPKKKKTENIFKPQEIPAREVSKVIQWLIPIYCNPFENPCK